MNKYIALVDADNFYVSCERLFKPALRSKPVVVLSNNDGCVVARSQEVKDMGVKMGTPYYRIKQLAAKNRIAVFSSNYELYGDISARVMNILSGFSAATEIYSIDEAFLTLDPDKAGGICERIIGLCRDWVSIPVKIGVSSTKTLAKLAAELVKKESLASRCKILRTQSEITEGLTKIELEDIWGLGRKTADRLKGQGIRTPFELANQPEAYIRKHFGVALSRTVMELQGVPCFDLEIRPRPQKNMCCSRSFGKCVTEYNELAESVSAYASEVAAKLRRRKLKTQSVSVFIMTDRFNQSIRQYANSACRLLPMASSDTLIIVKYALQALADIFRPGFQYKKSGVLLNDLIPAVNVQGDLFVGNDTAKTAVSEVMDAINAEYGAGSIEIGSAGLKRKKWRMIRRCKSPGYTTRWKDILSV